MRPARWLLMVLALACLASLAPVHAAPKTVEIIDAGTSDEPIDLPQVLSDEEVARINELQTGVRLNGLLSSVSPDDTTAWASLDEEIGFLNVQDGSFQPVDLSVFGPSLLPSAFIGFAPLTWLDATTIGGIGLDLSAEQVGNALVLLTLDRVTGQPGAIRLDPEALEFFFEPNVFIITFAPNATRLAVAVVEEEPNGEESEMVRLRIGAPRVDDGLQRMVPAAQQQRVDGLNARQSARHAKLNTLIDQQRADRSILQVTPTTTRIMSLDLLSGEIRELTSIDEASLLFAATWSKDSSHLALTTTGFPDLEARPRFRFDGALLSEEIYKDVTGQLAPADNPYLQNNVVMSFDVGTGEQKTLRAADGDGAFLFGYDWATDGKTLLVQGLHPARVAGRRNPIYTFQFAERYDYRFYNSDMKEIRRLDLPQLFSGISPVFGYSAAFMVSPDELIFTALSGENTHPYYYNAVSGELRNLADRAGTYLLQGATSRSRQLIFRHTSYTSPSDIYRIGWDGKSLARLSWVNEELRSTIKNTQHPVSFTLRNGQVRRGTLILPEGVAFPPKNVPIVVWQEGGPGGSMNNIYQAIVERPYALLPSFGFGVLIVPLSGREGYDGRTLNALADRSNFGSVDIDEQAEITRQIIAKGWTSQRKLGITGCSYGGYFVWQSIIRHPDLYAAANPQCALVDTITEWSRGYAILMPYLEGPATPYTANAEYRADSPTYNASKVRTPTLIFHGELDFLPVVQNENLFTAISDRGVTTRFLKFIGSGHGLVGVSGDLPEDVDQRFESYGAQEQIQWFRTYLK
jgi:dipeptidyl aminopeptidase/acylaminoacyl peptidase